MLEWWNSLDPFNQGLYVAASGFSILFLFQFIASLIGFGHHDVSFTPHGDLDTQGFDAGHMESHSAGEAVESVTSFKLLSVRAVLAFFLLFFWASALYMEHGIHLASAFLYGTFWGLGGWAVVIILFNFMRRLQETGNPRIATAVGASGSVHLDIPAGGLGEVRVAVSGVVTMVKARTADGQALKAGAVVKITKVIDPTTVEVEPSTSGPNEKEGRQ